MRTVAALLALSSVLLTIPLTQAADECFTDTTRQQICAVIPAAKPSSPPPAPGVPAQLNPYWGTYYLYFGPGACVASPASNDCRGTPATSNSGVPLPDAQPPAGQDGQVGAGVFGTLWKESNPCAGLQRRTVAPCLPDRMILV